MFKLSKQTASIQELNELEKKLTSIENMQDYETAVRNNKYAEDLRISLLQEVRRQKQTLRKIP